MDSSGEVATASAIRVVTKTGSYLFKVFGYSQTKGIGIGKYINSDVFTVGGYDWIIRYYPDGRNDVHRDFISFFLELKSAASDVRTKFSLDILQQNGLPFNWSIEPVSEVTTFNSTTGTGFSSWGYYEFANRNEFEASECLKDDAFTVRCTVTVVKDTKVEAIDSFGVVVPPSTLNQNLADMLARGTGADVTFFVKGEEFKAHRCVLAARSAVFNAMLFGCMKEARTGTVIVDDIEAPVFKSMLHFIYSDSLPSLGGKQDKRLMIEHLLVAADRYALQKLRLICEDALGKHLKPENAATTIILAKRYNCSQLEAHCLKFLSLPENFKEMAMTPEFEILKKTCPSVLEDLKSLELKR